jgi:DNA-binding XRE family transcriptional regulator
MANNALREIRESRLMSKAELANKAGISPITVSRIEKGLPCRLETKRKIILALGFDLGDKKKIFFD